MLDKPEVVQIKLDGQPQPKREVSTKAFQMKVDDNKSILVYNHIQGYILSALMKAVFDDAH